MDYRSQVALCAQAVFRAFHQARITRSLRCMWTVIALPEMRSILFMENTETCCYAFNYYQLTGCCQYTHSAMTGKEKQLLRTDKIRNQTFIG